MGEVSANVARAIAFRAGPEKLAIARKLIVRVCLWIIRMRFAVVTVIAFVANAIVIKKATLDILVNFVKNVRFVSTSS